MQNAPSSARRGWGVWTTLPGGRWTAMSSYVLPALLDRRADANRGSLRSSASRSVKKRGVRIMDSLDDRWSAASRGGRRILPEYPIRCQPGLRRGRLRYRAHCWHAEQIRPFCCSSALIVVHTRGTVPREKPDSGAISEPRSAKREYGNQMDPAFARAVIRSAARNASAWIVIVGCPRPDVTKLLPSTMNRFGTSCDR